ncbi:unnamed protein product [Clonostachys rosea f. rosea IK726]|uniref:Uncharacterized protein n=1 Tax=Clonostachys rosea f. rosea IK726 TaxID=1349383 RepID=A0ACA9U604_BIOOC|nr:unnamed protein product [Clonostachys rosea f. rosea IK726]
MLHARFPGARSTAPAYRALCSRGYAVGWETTYDIAVNACMVNPKFGKRPTITGPGPVGFLGDAGGGRDGEPMELAMRLIMG